MQIRGCIPGSILLKYSSEANVEEIAYEQGEAVLTSDELATLQSALLAAIGDYWPEAIPGEECRFCSFRAGCREAIKF